LRKILLLIRSFRKPLERRYFSQGFLKGHAGKRELLHLQKFKGLRV